MKRSLQEGKFWKPLTVLLVFYCGFLHLKLWNEHRLVEYLRSYISFSNHVSVFACADVEVIKQSAARAGFRLDDNIHNWLNEKRLGDPEWKVLEGGSSAVRLFVDPVPPLSKEPGLVINFDANGCVLH